MHVLGNLHTEADGAMVTCMVRGPGTRPKMSANSQYVCIGDHSGICTNAINI